MKATAQQISDGYQKLKGQEGGKYVQEFVSLSGSLKFHLMSDEKLKSLSDYLIGKGVHI